MRKALNVTLIALMGVALVGCKDKNSTSTEVVDASKKEQVLEKVMTPYVHHAVIPVYEGMADAAMDLAEDMGKILKAAMENPASEDSMLILNACTHWTESRMYWERSEAWLYGPADYEGIDPHIDSWPFDKTGFDDVIADAAAMETYAHALETNATLDEEEYGLLGFHALEYVLFEQGKAHKLSDFTVQQWTFMAVVANDLRNQAILLEACWRGMTNISSAKQALLTSAGLNTAAARYSTNGFGGYMTNPGEGRTFVTYEGAAAQLVEGCIDIANEVGNIKIGTACFASADNEADRNYIESPYSLHSIRDFRDNIVSVDYACYGAKQGDANLMDYIAQVDKKAAENLRDAIDKSYKAIEAIPEPFYENAQGEAAQKAVAVVGTDLVEALNAVHKALTGIEYEIEEEE